MSLSTSEMLLLAPIVLGAVWQIWDRVGKSRGDNLTRADAERERLEKRVEGLEGRLDAVEQELDELKRAHNVLLDFLRDVQGDYFSDLDAIKKRAKDLLDRFGGQV